VFYFSAFGSTCLAQDNAKPITREDIRQLFEAALQPLVEKNKELLRRELKRRSAIEATIGHMKTDGRLDRNFLLGHAGDAINALLAAAGHNLRLVLSAMALWLAFLLAAMATATAKSNTSSSRFHPKASMA
jgi:hypothetical protein